MKKRWQNYQVDNPKDGHPKAVSELTESEAKDELCNAMLLIEKLLGRSLGAIADARKARYYFRSAF